MTKSIREKKHRLPRIAYAGFVAVAFTANVYERKRPFIDGYIFTVFESFLLQELANHSCSSYVYLFMPDHIHFILAGKSEHSNLLDCMDMFKQKTGFWFYENEKDIRWQKGYYDHIIRNEKDMNAQLCYILMNPVRAGLVDSWKKYPFKGSTEFSFEDWTDEL